VLSVTVGKYFLSVWETLPDAEGGGQYFPDLWETISNTSHSLYRLILKLEKEKEN